MVRSVQLFAVVSLVVVGLSHIFRAPAWKAYFEMLRRQGGAGVMINGLMSLWFGAIIVAFHNIWSGPEMILTLLGWAQVLKGTLHLCVPGLGERSLGLVETNAEKKFIAGGVVMLVMAAGIGLALFRP